MFVTVGLAQAEATSQKLHLGFLCEWLEHKYLSYHLLPPMTDSSTELKLEETGLEPINYDMGHRCLKHLNRCINHPFPQPDFNFSGFPHSFLIA